MTNDSNWLSGQWEHWTMENEHKDYIKIKLKRFLNSDFAERMDCPKIKNEIFISC